MGRALRFLIGVLLCFSLATVIAEGILLGYAVSKWRIDREKVAQMLAIARGIGPAAPRPPGPPPEPAEQAPYQQVLEARALRDKNLQLREQALASALAQLRGDEQKLAEDRRLLEKRRADYAKEVADLKDGSLAEGRQEVRQILQNLKPKQAKEILLQMLDGNQTKDVVVLLSGMPDAKRARILGEFKTPEESKKIEDVLRLIGQGEPRMSVAEKAKEQMQEKPGG